VSLIVKESFNPEPTSLPLGFPLVVEIIHLGRSDWVLKFLQAGWGVIAPLLSIATTSNLLYLTVGFPRESAEGKLITAYFWEDQIERRALGSSSGIFWSAPVI